LEGFLGEEDKQKLIEVSELFNLEKVTNKSPFDYFEPLYLLRIKGDNDFENLIFSSFSSSLIDKINKIEQLTDYSLNFEIIFSEKQSRDEALEYLKLQLETIEFETEDVLSPFSSVFLNDESDSYFLLLKEKFLGIEKDLKIFTNVFRKEKAGP
jgi:hypothetical protein